MNIGNIAYIGSLNRLFFKILPQVEQELESWQQKLTQCGDNDLRKQAEASIKYKKFHCQGGSVYSLLAEPKLARPLIKAIVAVQTISDYLDNLCDRRGIEDEQAFRQVHNAFLDSLSLGELRGDYYKYYPDKEDEGYLTELVQVSRENLKRFPNYHKVEAKVLEFAEYYCHLQVYKHLQLEIREEKLLGWLKELEKCYPGFAWYELAAATGSTLGMFTLMTAATWPDLQEEEAKMLADAYFPWIAGLHILLDYYIDQGEDLVEGDLNFVAYYPNPLERQERILLFVHEALKRTKNLPDSKFHGMVVRGLLALYLTDVKLKTQGLEKEARGYIKKGGIGTYPLYGFCKTLRAVGKI